MRPRLLKGLGLALGLALFSCTPSPYKKSPLALQLPTLALTIDPHRMEDAYSMTVVLQVFRGLFRYTPEGEVEPDLVESWTETPQHKTYTFKLKKRTFSDGTPITAEHVRQSFARIFHLSAGIGADIDYIAGAKDFRTSKDINKLGVIALDPQTVQIKLERPSALVLKHLATVDCAILPLKKFDDELPAGVASGPYKVTQQDATRVRLTRWRPDELDSPNPPQEITFVKRAIDYKTSIQFPPSVDSFDDDALSDADIERLKKDGWKQFVSELARERFVILNPALVPQATREYLTGRVDPAILNGRLNYRFLTPAYGLIPPTMKGGLTSIDVRELQRSAPSSAPKGSITLSYVGDDEVPRRIAEELKSLWETPSFKVALEPLDRGGLLTKMFKKQGQVILGSKGVDYPDGYSVLTYFKGGYEANYFHVSDPAIDHSIEKAVTTFDPVEREGIYKKIQLEVLKKRTIIPLFFGHSCSGMWSQRVSKVRPHPMGLHTLPLETVEMKQ